MKYLLCDRELNGYDDSDFYAVFYDTETETIRSEVYGSTRYPSPRSAPSDEYLSPVSDEIRAKAKAFFLARIYEYLRDKDRRDVDEPENAERGDQLVTLKTGTFKDKKAGTATPYKQGEVGTVIWVGAFGKFYRDGYNHPGRHNRRVGLKLDDGQVIFIALKDCKLAREYKTDDELMHWAKVNAESEDYHIMFGQSGYIKL